MPAEINARPIGESSRRQIESRSIIRNPERTFGSRNGWIGLTQSPLNTLGRESSQKKHLIPAGDQVLLCYVTRVGSGV